MQVKQVKRVFSLELKKELVRKVEKGELRVIDISRIYSVSKQAIYQWLDKYSDIYKRDKRVVVESKSVSLKNKELTAKIRDLEQALGQHQMRVSYLEKLLELGSEDLGIDIEKKFKRLP